MVDAFSFITARRRRAAIARDVAALRRYNATNVAPRYVENYYRTMALTGRKPKFADGYQAKWDERVTPEMIIRRKLGADWEALRRRQERDKRFMASFSDPKLPLGGPLAGDEGYRYPEGALFDPTALPKTRVRRPLVAKAFMVDGKKVTPNDALRAVDQMRGKAAGTSRREFLKVMKEKERRETVDPFKQFVENRHGTPMSCLSLQERRNAYGLMNARGYLVHAFKHSRPSHHIGPCDDACRRGLTHHPHRTSTVDSRYGLIRRRSR